MTGGAARRRVQRRQRQRQRGLGGEFTDAPEPRRVFHLERVRHLHATHRGRSLRLVRLQPRAGTPPAPRPRVERTRASRRGSRTFASPRWCPSPGAGPSPSRGAPTSWRNCRGLANTPRSFVTPSTSFAASAKRMKMAKSSAYLTDVAMEVMDESHSATNARVGVGDVLDAREGGSRRRMAARRSWAAMRSGTRYSAPAEWAKKVWSVVMRTVIAAENLLGESFSEVGAGGLSRASRRDTRESARGRR